MVQVVKNEEQPVACVIQAEMVDVVCDCGCAKAERIYSELPVNCIVGPPINTPAQGRCSYASSTSKGIIRGLATAAVIYVALAIAVITTTAVFIPSSAQVANLLLCSFIPAIYIIIYLGCLHRKSVLAVQILWTCLETLCYMCPLGELYRTNGLNRRSSFYW